jgi:hypothetical protein
MPKYESSILRNRPPLYRDNGERVRFKGWMVRFNEHAHYLRTRGKFRHKGADLTNWMPMKVSGYSLWWEGYFRWLREYGDLEWLKWPELEIDIDGIGSGCCEITEETSTTVHFAAKVDRHYRRLDVRVATG